VTPGFSLTFAAILTNDTAMRAVRNALSGRGTGWNRRSVAVIGAGLSGLALPVTGLLDHAAGREWALPHVAVALVCVLFCAWHVALNWRPLISRARQVATGSRNRQAVIVVAAALLGVTLPVTGLLDHAAGRACALPHALPGVLCLCLLTWHAVLHRSALARYVRTRPPGHRLPSGEALAPAVLTVAVLAGSTLHSLGV
jgi:hypothetical protein